MVRVRNRRCTMLLLSIPVALFGALGWLAYGAVQRINLRRPLVAAVKRNDTAAVKELLDSGVDPNTRDTPQLTLSWEDTWRSLWHKETPDTFLAPVLQYAVVKGNLDMTRLLIAHGAEVNAMSGYYPSDLYTESDVNSYPAGAPGGFTALMDAVYIDRLDLVSFLLEHGADPNLHPKGEVTALMWASGPREGATEEALRMGATHVKEIIKILLEYGADARVIGPNGETALKMALDSNWPAVRLLVEKGGDVNTRADDKWSRTLLIEASVIEDTDLIKFLVAHGADVNATDSAGQTALMAVCRRLDDRDFSLEGAQSLLDHGANPNAQDRDGFTALMEAVGGDKRGDSTVGGNIDAVQLLLQHGADPNLKDKRGQTALQKAGPVVAEDAYGLQLLHILQQAAARR